VHGTTLHASCDPPAAYPAGVPPASKPPSVGDRMTVDVRDVAHGGHMVARHDGFVIFVRYALPGERVVAEVTDVRRGFARAEAIEIVVSNPHRVAPRCPSFHPFGCGGCDFQHADIGLQREMKTQILREALVRQGRLDPDYVGQLTQSGLRSLGSDWQWRSRMRFSVLGFMDGTWAPGMHAYRSTAIVPADRCMIAEPSVLESAKGAIAQIASNLEIGSQPDLEVVAATDGIATEAAIGPTDQRLRHRVEIDGNDVDFDLPLGGFWQAQRALVPAIVNTVLEFGGPRDSETWWDLYAGAGPITAGLAIRVGATGAIHAVESDPDAVAAARRTFATRDWVDVHRSDVRRWLAAGNRARPDGVVMDPPRSGAGEATLNPVVALRPRVIVYVACDPVALGRDVAVLAARGYRLTDLRAWDAFPQTHHLEAVCAFEPDDRLS